MTTRKVVGIADCIVSSDPKDTLLTFALGSCIAVTIHDPVARVGALLHFLLPDCSMDTLRGRDNPFVYATTGIPEMLNLCLRMGAQKKRLVVSACGGASVMDGQGVFNIGKRNDLGLRKTMWKAGLLIHAEALGGDVTRTVQLEIETGRVLLREDSREAVPLLSGSATGTREKVGKHECVNSR